MEKVNPVSYSVDNMITAKEARILAKNYNVNKKRIKETLERIFREIKVNAAHGKTQIVFYVGDIPIKETRLVFEQIEKYGYNIEFKEKNTDVDPYDSNYSVGDFFIIKW